MRDNPKQEKDCRLKVPTNNKGVGLVSDKSDRSVLCQLRLRPRRKVGWWWMMRESRSQFIDWRCGWKGVGHRWAKSSSRRLLVVWKRHLVDEELEWKIVRRLEAGIIREYSFHGWSTHSKYSPFIKRSVVGQEIPLMDDAWETKVVRRLCTTISPICIGALHTSLCIYSPASELRPEMCSSRRLHKLYFCIVPLASFQAYSLLHATIKTPQVLPLALLH